jgi:pimeloyl-ACP methyl ester carboxylesterase
MPKLRDRQRTGLAIGMVVVALFLSCGCSVTPTVKQVSNPCDTKAVAAIDGGSRLTCPERLDQGYTIVLPGIWGAQPVDYGIVMGLKDGNVPSAIELYDWTDGALRLVHNLRAIDHNQREAHKIAAKIVAYQDRYPGRSVHLVGYSGGAGVAVLTLEALPPGRRVTNAILLAPTLASNYDLRPAIGHTTHGIRNFYSPLDVPILMVLSTAFGTTEGQHVAAAGAIGFQAPKDAGPEAQREYELQVLQQSYNLDMLKDWHPGGHFGWANRTFIAHHVAPLLNPSAAPLPPTDPASAAPVDRLTARPVSATEPSR